MGQTSFSDFYLLCKDADFSCEGKIYTDSSVRASYTAFFLDLCKNEEYLQVFDEKGYFYSSDILAGDKEWEKDFVQVEEGKYFHVDYQVFVFLLKAVRAIIDLGNEKLLNQCSIIYGSLREELAVEDTINKNIDKINGELYGIDELKKMLKRGENILLRVEKDAIYQVIMAIEKDEEPQEDCLKRTQLASSRLENNFKIIM